MLDIKIYDESNGKNCPLILINVFDIASSKNINDAIKKLTNKSYTLLCVTTSNIENALRPWKIDKNESNAKSYLEELKTLLDEYKNKDIYIIGYSLSGLFALYSLYNLNMFKRAAFISASLWYPNLLDYIDNNKLLSNVDRTYFSVGDLESKSKNKLFSTVLDNTKLIKDKFIKMGIKSKFELNSGNHFTDMELRIAKGVLYLLEGECS